MDPVADMLTIIRNGQAVKKKTVRVSFSKLKLEVAKILEKKDFIAKIGKKGRGTKKIMELKLKYKEGEPVISGLKKISKPGQPIYIGVRDIRPVRSGYGIIILSTSKGIMTGKEAKKKRLGGEAICKVW